MCNLYFQEKGFSVILSDMCPVVSGITTKDAALSVELGRRALSLAVGKVSLSGSADDSDDREPDANEAGVLRRGGNLVIKLLESEDVQGIIFFTSFLLDYCIGTQLVIVLQDFQNFASLVSRRHRC